MKQSKNKKLGWLFAGMGLLMIPTTLWAISDSTLTIYYNGVFSGAYAPYPSSTRGVAIGNSATWSSSAHSVLVVGTGSYGYDSDSVVVGRYNENTGGDEAFVVGIGNGIYNDPEYKKNALEVFKNGDVVIPKAQGDISMGIYAP